MRLFPPSTIPRPWRATLPMLPVLLAALFAYWFVFVVLVPFLLGV